ncbi:sirohydrochlorin chelatase [Naumannella huperziae]
MTSPEPRPILLLAHGSPDPRHGEGVRRLATAVAERHPAPVRVAYLDHHGPTPEESAAELGPRGILVPVLLTRAHHARTDVPAIMERIRARPGLDGFAAAPPLGPDPLVGAGLAELLARAGATPDADTTVLVYVPGSSDRDAVAAVGAELAKRPPGTGWAAWRVAALDGGTTLAQALAELPSSRAVAVSYMIADGVLRDRMVERCAEAGVPMIDGVLADTAALASLAISRGSG